MKTLPASFAKPVMLVALAGCSLAGCTGSLLDSERPLPRTYVLAPAAGAERDAGTVDIMVAEPSVAPGLNTDRIVILYPDRRLDYYAGSRWGAPVAQMMQSMVVGSLRNLGGFRSVTAAPVAATPAYVVDFELRDFQAQHAGDGVAPRVRVSIVANVLRIADRQLLVTIPATAEVASGSDRLGAVVQAFETAAQEVATALSRESLAAIAKAPVSQAPVRQ